MNKRILFIGGNFYPEPIGIGKYNGEMIEFLSKEGYQCTVVTSFPYYPTWKVEEPYTKKKHWYKKETITFLHPNATPVTVYRCPQYTPAKPTGKRRMLLDLTFLLSVSLIFFRLLFRKKYDMVITVAPCFQVGLFGLFYKRIRGGKCIYHIQDLQIDAARDLNMIKSKKLLSLLSGIERFILKNSDTVSSISPAMIQKIKIKCNREIVSFPNWVNTSLFYPMEEKAKLKEEYNFKPNDKIVLYSGAIGEKQCLEAIIMAADKLRDSIDLKFVICGTGPYKEKLIQMTQTHKLDNVFFMPLQPTEKLNRFLNMADIHLVLQKATTEDSVMPSKLTTIFSVGGLAIITATEKSMLYDTILKNEIGIVVEPENSQALTKAIENILTTNKRAICQNARSYAEQNLSIEKIFMSYSVNI